MIEYIQFMSTAYMNSVASGLAPKDEKLSDELVAFAWRMKAIPRKAVRCEIYDTVSVVVDQAHTLNIFRKVFAGHTINKNVAYRALNVLQDRIDERQAA